MNKFSEQQYAILLKHASSYTFENFTCLCQKKKCDLSSSQNAKALILCVLSSWCQEGEFEVDTHMLAQIKSSIKVRLRAQCSHLEQTGRAYRNVQAMLMIELGVMILIHIGDVNNRCRLSFFLDECREKLGWSKERGKFD